tara:strand:- start:5702 stop:6004 length:303 start_codon:yes stop_codon:yes gene_type:complete
MIYFLEKLKLKSEIKKNYFAIFFSFFIGIIIPAIPYLINIISDLNNKRIIDLKNKSLRLELGENCRSKNNKYKRLSNLGFEKFALEELNTCIEKSLNRKN